MIEDTCYLCASDEGVLLDIFGDTGKSVRENIETCLSVKINKTDVPTTKICHKCVYELDSCGKFLKKYKVSKTLKTKKIPSKKESCSLCEESGRKTYLLQVSEGKALKYSLKKIQQVLDDDVFSEKVKDLSICLGCRYNLDVLFDLKHIYEETLDKLNNVIKNNLKLTQLPKTQTSVVSRKTTEIPPPKLNGEQEYGSDTSIASSTMFLKRRGRPRKAKDPAQKATTAAASANFRNCGECGTQVESGIDMYRYHRTGLTVCRECWLTIDPEKMVNGKRKRIKEMESENSTKLCAVYLKDVLSNPLKYENLYKKEKDNDGNTTFLITDDSSEYEGREPTRQLRTRSTATASKSENVEDVSETKKGTKRQISKKNEHENVKKAKSSTRKSDESSDSTASKLRSTDDAESVLTTKTRSTRNTQTKAMPSPELTTVKKATVKKRGRPLKNVKKVDTSSEESSSCEVLLEKSSKEPKSILPSEDLPKSRKIARKLRARSNSFTNRQEQQLKNSSSESSELQSSESEIVIPKKRSKVLESESEPEEPYTCTVCLVSFKNKLIGKSHELTHEKQPKVKLCRVVVSSETGDEKSPDLADNDELNEESPEKSDSIEKIQKDSEERTPETDSEKATDVLATIENPDIDKDVTLNEGETSKTEGNEISEGSDTESSSENTENNEKISRERKIKRTRKEKSDEASKENTKDENENKMKETVEGPSNVSEEDKNKEEEEVSVQENVEKVDSTGGEETEKTNDKIAESEQTSGDKLTNNDIVHNESIEDQENSECVVQVEEEQEKEKHEQQEPEKKTEEEEDKKEDESDDDKEDEEKDEDKVDEERDDVKEDEEKDNEKEVEEKSNEEEETKKGSEKDIEASTEMDVSENIQPVDSTENNDSSKAVTREESMAEEENLETEEVIEKEEKAEFEVSVESEKEKEIEEIKNTQENKNDDKSTDDVEEIQSEKNDEEKDEEEERQEETMENENDPTDDKISNIEEKSFDKDESDVATSSQNATEEKDVNGCEEQMRNGQKENQEEKTDQLSDEEPTSTASDVAPEIFDLASAEVKKRLENVTTNEDNFTAETLENITLEIRKSGENLSCEMDESVETNTET